MTYLAVARITVGDKPGRQIRDLIEGLGRVVEELHDRGMSLDDIGTEFESACEGIRWDEERRDGE